MVPFNRHLGTQKTSLHNKIDSEHYFIYLSYNIDAKAGRTIEWVYCGRLVGGEKITHKNMKNGWHSIKYSTFTNIKLTLNEDYHKPQSKLN